jgi:glutathione S-transferase
MMQLFFSPTSPYARKVIIVAIETGLVARIETIHAKPHPIERDQAVVLKNPLGKVPTLVTDDGETLFDSRVICEYLASISDNTQIFPHAASGRWNALSLQALADGILDAALLIRYEETLREPDLQSEAWKTGQWEKLTCALDALEARAGSFSFESDIGLISIACALGYLDFRFMTFDWRSSHTKLSAWLATFEKRESIVQSRHRLPA